MNSITLTLGILAVLYGLYTVYARRAAPAQLGKLAAMQDRWGKTPGMLLHLMRYSIVPIFVGCSLIYAGLFGVSLF